MRGSKIAASSRVSSKIAHHGLAMPFTDLVVPLEVVIMRFRTTQPGFLAPDDISSDAERSVLAYWHTANGAAGSTWPN